ncbi:MAG: sigma-70 family RNA polymerase sigma factor [Candidatus Eisenbacteria bacterium]|jgi:RNA polymerase sigma-70 factor (ECF subfamily)|nr:sigma-70 family RNA polymerase sigma factor [Candidatus Eisenbacteria bacterium]
MASAASLLPRRGVRTQSLGRVLSLRGPRREEQDQAAVLMEESDDGLMVRVKRGDHQAFRILAERYRTRVFRFIYKMIHDEEVAEDLAQETFLRVFKRANTYKPGSNFSIWLYTIAKNLTFNRVRDEKRQPLGLAEQVDQRYWDVATADVGPDPLEMSQREEIRRTVNSGLAQLPPKFKAAVILRDIEGFEYEQIAKILRCPLGTVKSRVNRGRLRLRDLIKERLHEYLE